MDRIKIEAFTIIETLVSLSLLSMSILICFQLFLQLDKQSIKVRGFYRTMVYEFIEESKERQVFYDEEKNIGAYNISRKKNVFSTYDLIEFNLKDQEIILYNKSILVSHESPSN